MCDSKTIFQVIIPELVSIPQVGNWISIQHPEIVTWEHSGYDNYAKLSTVRRRSHIQTKPDQT